MVEHELVGHVKTVERTMVECKMVERSTVDYSTV